MNNKNPLLVLPEIDKAIEEHGFQDSSDEELKSFLSAMCQLTIHNDTVRERYLLRGFTINYVQMSRLISKLNDQNKKATDENIVLQRTVVDLTKDIHAMTGWLKWLTIVLTAIAAVSMYSSLKQLATDMYKEPPTATIR